MSPVKYEAAVGARNLTGRKRQTGLALGTQRPVRGRDSTANSVGRCRPSHHANWQHHRTSQFPERRFIGGVSDSPPLRYCHPPQDDSRGVSLYEGR